MSATVAVNRCLRTMASNNTTNDALRDKASVIGLGTGSLRCNASLQPASSFVLLSEDSTLPFLRLPKGGDSVFGGQLMG